MMGNEMKFTTRGEGVFLKWCSNEIYQPATQCDSSISNQRKTHATKFFKKQTSILPRRQLLLETQSSFQLYSSF